MRICITTGSRIHLGFHTFPPSKAAWSGAGVYLSEPRLVLCYDTHGDWLEVEEDIPRHRGLGSTTQRLLAEAKLHAYIRGEVFDWRRTVLVKGRYKTSRVGALLFRYGGLVIDGTRDPHKSLKPLVRMRLPRHFRFVLVDPRLPRGPSEQEESLIWDNMPAASPRLSREGRRAAVKLAEAALKGDATSFLEAAVMLDRVTGSYFSGIQGGGSRSDILGLQEAARGLGIVLMQSSWGPVMYTVADSKGARRIARLLRGLLDRMGLEGRVWIARPRNRGAFLHAGPGIAR